MENKLYFSDKEIECKCGCGFRRSYAPFYGKVNTVRSLVGHPLRANSWCRCPLHNKEVGGSITSSHLKGLAVDLATPTAYLRYLILLAAGQVGFRGVGVASTFIHLDDDPSKDPHRFWIY